MDEEVFHTLDETSLKCDNKSVSDLSPLKELTHLKELDLSSTKVTDLSPLLGLKNLKILYLKNTIVPDAQVTALKKALPNLGIKH